ncbi:hypothetical protein GGI21_004968 [Coemansia aciculifera]|nr:hypothetical protein GGI21_004968 [Coemansia aciculifera]
MSNSYGVYEQEYENLYSGSSGSDNKGSISPVISIGAAHLASTNLFMTIAGVLCERIGMGLTTLIGALMVGMGLFTAGFCTKVWQLALTQGVLAGGGVGTVYIVVSTIPASWFSKKQGFIIGLVHAGSGVGGLVLAPLTQFIINTRGLSGSLKVLGLVLVAGLFVTGLGMASKPDEQSDQDDEDTINAMLSTSDSCSEHKAGSEHKTSSEHKDIGEHKTESLAMHRLSAHSLDVQDMQGTSGVLRSQEFWYLNVAVMLAEAGFYVVLFFLPVFSSGIGLTNDQGAMIAGVANGATIIGRIGIGYVADVAGNINMFLVSHIAVTLLCVLLWFPAKSYTVMMIFAFTFGLFSGGLAPLVPLCSVTLFGKNGLANNVGLLGIGMVLTTGAAPVVARVFYQKLGQSGGGYGTVALFCGGIYFLATVSVLALRVCVSRQLWKKI